MRQRTWIPGVVSLLISTVGCSTGATSPSASDRTAAQVDVSMHPANALVRVGEGVQLTVVMGGGEARPVGLVDAEVRWVSSNEAVATVAPSGLVQARGIGTATITAIVNASCGMHLAVGGVTVQPFVGTAPPGPPLAATR